MVDHLLKAVSFRLPIFSCVLLLFSTPMSKTLNRICFERLMTHNWSHHRGVAVVIVVAAVDDLCIFMDLKSLSHLKF